jgi:hypothetical protein
MYTIFAQPNTLQIRWIEDLGYSFHHSDGDNYYFRRTGASQDHPEPEDFNRQNAEQ